MATYADVKRRALEVLNETQIGKNTASRIGGILADLCDMLKGVDGSISDVDSGKLDYKSLEEYLSQKNYVSRSEIPTSYWGQTMDSNRRVKGDMTDVGSLDAKGKVTSKESFQVGDFTTESGGDFSVDEEGNSHLTTDFLSVRRKATFEELEILKTSTVGGKLIISPVGSNRIAIVDEERVTYNGLEQDAYRCYFLAEQDSEKIDNNWSVGDQARSESFNLTAGKYHHAGNHFLWRLVIGRSEAPVTINGKSYHWVDLSMLDYSTGSDAPEVGDVLNQVGNRNDIERQNCLVFSAVDTYSPSITLYHGINDYSFANKEYVEYGVVKSTGKAFFNVYGDAYIGDRPTAANNYDGASYIKYDSDKKKVVIKGELSVKSTVDGTTLDKYIEGKTLSESEVNNLINNSTVISDLQNQIDGAIETWFYDGVPSLTNKPAIDWVNADKGTGKTATQDKHLGDLYYDNKTGKAYRFAKDGSVYKWTVITDTDITKALSDAAKAQETADGKMTVFSSQPTPPYQTGDIWVNATYPASTGTTYKNDVLRCKTAKAAGKTFSIDDWMLASKYTDDTVANEAKKAAEEAQKNIKTTQENLKTLDGTVTNNRSDFDKFTKDGYLDSSEIAAMAQDSKRLEDAFTAAEKSYNEVKDSASLLDEHGNDVKQKTDLIAAYKELVSKKTALLTYLSDIVTRYNAADTNGKATINAAVASHYTNFQTAYDDFYNKLGLANAYVISTMYTNLKEVIGDTTSLEYLKKALVDAQDTKINGGLILSSLLALRDTNGKTMSGINGIVDSSANGKGLAAWFGGEMVDKDYNDGTKTPAVSAIRFDGSGYFANGAIWWGADGKFHADPTSFIINESNIGVYLSLFEPTWKSGSKADNVADILSLKPCAPFSSLSVSGNVNVDGGYVKIGGAYLVYKDKALMMSADKDGNTPLNVYATGGLSAYGNGNTGSAGGGLNGQIIKYTDAILQTTANESEEVASAWSIKMLSDRIEKVSKAIPSINVDVPTTGNALTGATYDDETGKLTFTKGTFLTSHQSLAAYLKSADAKTTYAPISHKHTKVDITDMPTDLGDFTNTAGFTKNTGTVTSVGLTLPTGLTLGTTKTITSSGTFAVSFSTGYSIPTTTKQKQWDTAYANNHTHSNKKVLDGISAAKVSNWDSTYDWYKLMTTDEEEADGVINKWNEVVNFLANIAQTDTLSGIVDGINKSISDEVTRAKKAEGTNATNISNNAKIITTLKGYFDASGNAKSALKLTNSRKLWGNSFNGSADINGNITMQSTDGTYIQIGGIRIVYDEKNTALKIVKSDGTTAANLYATGGLSAYGSGSVSSGGGGLNADILTYEQAKAMTDSLESTKVASAWSIKQLSERISNLDLKGDALSAITATTSGTGNALTSVSYDANTGKFTFSKGSTFSLSTHNHDSVYAKQATTLAGYGITDAKIANGVITLGANTITPITSHQSLANYYTKTEVGNLLSAKSATSHTHSVKINGTTKTIAATGGTAVDLGTYLVSSDLASYVNAIETSGTGNAITSVTKSGKKLTFTKGSTFLTAHQSIYGLTIQKNGSSLGTYTPNSAAKTINVTVPTKISDLTDNSYGYILKEYTIDASSLDENTYYPVVFNLGYRNDVLIQCIVSLNSSAPSWGTHSSKKFSVCKIWKTNGSGWGTRDIRRRILVSDFKYATSDPVVGIGQLTNSSNEYVYVRGGGKYFFRTSHNVVPKLCTEAYTPGGTSYGQTIAPTTTRPAEITKTIAYLTDNVASATKLATARTINGTSFNGTANITTANWGTARSIGIVNSDGTGTAVTVSVNGSANVNLKLPSTIKASLTGNASTATKLAKSVTLWGNSFDGSASISGNMTGIGSTNHARLNIVSTSSSIDYLHLYVSSNNPSYTTSRPLVLQNGYGNVGIGVVAPSEKLHVGGKINLNGIVLEYDSTNKALKVNGSLYATGGITAYGEGSASGSGGLNGSVMAYDSAIKLTTEDTTQIASAYSIAKLKSLIDGIDGSALTEVDWSIIKNKPSTFTPASHSHTFASLTSKPTTLSGFGITDGVNAVSVSGSGNAVTSASISNHTLTLTKGTTFASQTWVQDSAVAYKAKKLYAGQNGYLEYIVGQNFTVDGASGAFKNEKPNVDIGGNAQVIRMTWDNTAAYYSELLFHPNYDGHVYYRKISANKVVIENTGQDKGGWRALAFLSDIPSSLPANDVYSWAKASTKPSYSWSEIGSRPIKLSQFTDDVVNGKYLKLSGGTLTGGLSFPITATGCNLVYAGSVEIGSTALTNWLNSKVSYIGSVQTESAWQNVISVRHNNGSGDGTKYGMYIRTPLFGDDSLYYRTHENGTWHAERKIIDSVTIGSQSVNYANSAGAVAWSNVTGKPFNWSGQSGQPSWLWGSNDGSNYYVWNPTAFNVYSAKRLANARTLWGQSFNGTEDISGTISDIGVGSCCIRPGNDTSGLSALNNVDIKSWWGVSFSCGIGIGVVPTDGVAMSIDCRVGDLSIARNFSAKGGITAYSSSDLRLKTNLHKADSLSLIKSLGSVYEFDYRKTNEHSYGLIAQNVQKSRLSDLVANDDEGYLKLNYWSPKLISLALGGIVQVDDKVTKLKKKVARLEKRIKELEKTNTMLLEDKKDKDNNISNNA